MFTALLIDGWNQSLENHSFELNKGIDGAVRAFEPREAYPPARSTAPAGYAAARRLRSRPQPARADVLTLERLVPLDFLVGRIPVLILASDVREEIDTGRFLGDYGE